jgi:preprotein translocase subunit Sss1
MTMTRDAWIMVLVVVGFVMSAIGLIGGVEVGKGIVDPAFAILLIPGAIGMCVGSIMLVSRE